MYLFWPFGNGIEIIKEWMKFLKWIIMKKVLNPKNRLGSKMDKYPKLKNKNRSKNVEKNGSR